MMPEFSIAAFAFAAGIGVGFWRGVKWFEHISRWKVTLIENEIKTMQAATILRVSTDDAAAILRTAMTNRKQLEYDESMAETR